MTEEVDSGEISNPVKWSFMTWDALPLTGPLISKWFSDVVKRGPKPDLGTCDNIAIVLNGHFHPLTQNSNLFNNSSIILNPTSNSSSTLKRRREAIRILQDAAQEALADLDGADPTACAAFEALKSALDGAKPFLVGVTRGPGRPSGVSGRRWMFIAIVAAEVIKGVLIDMGHVNPGINKNSHVSRFLELLLKH